MEVTWRVPVRVGAGGHKNKASLHRERRGEHKAKRARQTGGQDKTSLDIDVTAFIVKTRSDCENKHNLCSRDGDSTRKKP